METKKFRKIYWVTEQFDKEGQSEVTGVYTSVPDLADKGFALLPSSSKTFGYRISLVQLDKPGVLGVWSSPDYTGLAEDLEDFKGTGEISELDYETMVTGVKSVMAGV